MPTKNPTINLAYHFLAEAMIIFLIAIPFMNGQYNWVPYWGYLGLATGICILYSVYSIYQTDLSWYIVTTPVIIAIFYFAGYPIFLAIAFPILLTFRYVFLKKDSMPSKELTYLNLSIPVAIIMLLWIQNPEIVVYVFLLLMLLLIGNIYSHLYNLRKGNRQNIGKKLWLTLGSFTGLLAIGITLLFIFRDVFIKIWFALMEIPGYIGGKIGMLFGYFFPSPELPNFLKGKEIEDQFEQNGGVEQDNHEVPEENGSSLLEDYAYLIYWAIAIIILIIILIMAIRFFRHRFKAASESASQAQVQYSSLDMSKESHKSIFSRLFKAPNNKVRKLIYQFERDAEKAGAGRYSYETLDTWMERLGFQIDLTAYKKVRYGSMENVNDDEVQTLKEQLQAIRNDLKTRRSKG